MKKKAVALCMAALFVVTSLAGCGSTDGSGSSAANNTQSVESAGDAQVSGSNFNETGYPIVDEPITLKIMMAIRDLDSIMDPSEMPQIQRLEELTGIKTEWEVIKESDWSTKLNLAFASGEYPDVILSTQAKVDYEEYGVVQGIFLPLDELIDQYMPTYKGRIDAEDDDPTVSLIASDGQKYTVGFMWAQSINTSQHYFINQEWLDALKLQTPTNVEELTEVLRAFKAGDPNGNGEADEIPLEMGLDIGLYGVRYMFPLFGIPCDPEKWIYIDEDKKVQFVATQDGFRELMEWLNQLYKEELIDPEVLSQDSNTLTTKLKEGNVGFFNGWRLLGMGFEDGVQSNCVLWTPDSSASFYRRLEVATPGALVTCTNENVEATMRWLDALLDTEVQFSLYLGEQDATDGTGWKYDENGKISSLNFNTNDTVHNYMDCNALFFGPGKYVAEIYNMPDYREEKMIYCQLYEEAGLIQKYSNDYMNMAPLTSEQLQSCALKETDINNAVVENMATFITDGVTDDSWNAFVSMFENMGVDEYIQMYQDAIDSMDID